MPNSITIQLRAQDSGESTLGEMIVFQPDAHRPDIFAADLDGLQLPRIVEVLNRDALPYKLRTAKGWQAYNGANW